MSIHCFKGPSLVWFTISFISLSLLGIEVMGDTSVLLSCDHQGSLKKKKKKELPVLLYFFSSEDAGAYEWLD